MKILSLLMCTMFLYVAPALAQPVIYSRDSITIAPKKIVKLEKESPLAEGEKPKPEAPPAVRPDHTFNVEIRSAESRQSDNMFLTHPFSESDGMMRVYNQPKLVVVTAAAIYIPLDILFIREDGTIMQIAPETDLSALSEDIVYEEPIKAVLYLKSGLSKKLDIRPGDWIRHGLFKRNPEILTNTQQH